VQLGRLDAARADQLLGSIRTTTHAEDLAEADLVIESAFEEVAVKQQVLGCWNPICPPDTILATNTSTISLDVGRGDGASRAADRHALLQPGASDAAGRDHSARRRIPLGAGHRAGLAKRLRKTPVVVANREGFLVNRIFIPYLQEAFFLLEDGASKQKHRPSGRRFRFPDGAVRVDRHGGARYPGGCSAGAADAFPHHGPLSSIAPRLVESGALGQKSGGGVYRYDPGDVKPHPSPATGRIVAEVRRASGRPPREIRRTRSPNGLILRMVNEAFYAVQEGIVQRESDVDVALVLATGFPDFRGGVLKYAAIWDWTRF
jgi:3-hydroxyacyl-CoA dehydrogenase